MTEQWYQWQAKDFRRGSMFYVPRKVVQAINEKVSVHSDDPGFIGDMSIDERHASFRYLLTQNIRLIVNKFIMNIEQALVRQYLEDDPNVVEMVIETWHKFKESVYNENPEFYEEIANIPDPTPETISQTFANMPSTHDIFMGLSDGLFVVIPEEMEPIVRQTLNKDVLEKAVNSIKHIIALKLRRVLAASPFESMFDQDTLDSINVGIVHIDVRTTENSHFGFGVSLYIQDNKIFTPDEDELTLLQFDGMDVDEYIESGPVTRLMKTINSKIAEFSNRNDFEMLGKPAIVNYAGGEIDEDVIENIYNIVGEDDLDLGLFEDALGEDDEGDNSAFSDFINNDIDF